MRSKWSIISVIFIIIGVFGLLKYGIGTSEDKAAYSKRWTFGTGELKQLAIETEHDIDVQFVRSGSGDNYVEATGNAVQEIIDKLEGTSLQNGKLNLDITKDTWKLTFFSTDFKSSQQQIVVALSDPAALEELKIHTSSDDIKVKDAAARSIDLNSSSGDMALTNVRADRIKLESSSGDLVGNGVTGALEARTSSGDIHIKDVDGNVMAEASSGDVILGLNRSAAASVNTSSGDVVVTVPQDFGGTYEVRSSSGSIVTPSSRKTTNDVVRIQTSSGDIIVQQ